MKLYTFPTAVFKQVVIMTDALDVKVQMFEQESTGNNIEGSRPQWCISRMIYSGDTPFWLETLDMGMVSSLFVLVV